MRRNGATAFIAAVAAYGQLLRGDTNMAGFSFAEARALAAHNTGQDFWRRALVGLLDLASRRQVAMGGDR